jgi:DNA-binding transcriptional LysR family regulator
MDKLRALHYLVVAAEERSFSAAARRLGVSTAAVAKGVSALEREVGAALFERSARGLLATPAGARYLETCSPALHTLREAEEDLRARGSQARGRLVVGVQHVVARGCLTAELPRFHARHPEIELDVREVSRVTDETVSAVDVMVVLGWPKVEQAVQRRIGAGRFIVAAAPRYWAAHGAPQRPSDLVRHNCLLIRGVEGTLMDMWSFRRGSEQEDVVVKGWLLAANAQRDIAIQLALQGEGVVRLLDWANREELASGALVPALSDWESPEVPPVNLVYNPHMRRVPRARAFIDFVSGVFRDIDAARAQQLRPTERPLWQRRPYGKASNCGDGRARPIPGAGR